MYYNTKKRTTATIDLRFAIHDNGMLLVYFGDSSHNWTLECKVTDLQTFKRFQAKVAEKLGVWIDHDSQDHRVGHNRTRGWDSAVAAAFAQGAVA